MKRAAAWMLLVLPLAGAAAGWSAGPAFARLHRRVRLAETVAREDTLGLQQHTLESAAFRAAARPKRELFQTTRRLRRRFSAAAAAFGFWCGLVAAVKAFALTRVPRREIYEIDHAACVCCARCFSSCPIQRAQPDDPGPTPL